MTKLDHIQALAGLLLIGVGAWFVYPPAAAVAVGALLMANACWGGRK